MMKQQPVLSSSMLVGIAALSVALVGCSGGDAPGGDKGGDKGGDQGGDVTKPPPQDVSYYRDVKAIVDQKCIKCHTEGGIAPFTLTSFDDVRRAKDAIGPAISIGVMPPWPPSKDCGQYMDDRSLSEAQIATINAWIAADGPEGDPSEAPPPIEVKGGLSRVDLTLGLSEAYTPKTSPDDYRCFLVDWPAQQTTYVTGFGVTPGTPAIVHHVIAFVATPDKVATYQALDAAEEGPGYTCFGGPGGGNLSWLGGWAPGSLGADFPAGTGIEVAAGSKIVVQIHYNTLSAPPSADQTKIALKTDAAVEKKAAVLPWANPTWVTSQTMTIPAHTPDTKHTWSIDPSLYLGSVTKGVLANNKPFTIYSAGLHMHTRGTHAVTSIARSGGANECLLDIERWNFHWQGSYGMVQPKQFNPGDKLSLECHWANDGAVDINWGEGTGDEMCLGTYYVTQ
jgi:mono/diheme cytochrome c family protein